MDDFFPTSNNVQRTSDANPPSKSMVPYRDFAHDDVEDPAVSDIANVDGSARNKRSSPQAQSQKLPSKLYAMLDDPDLASVITWMPHGRSWKVLDREVFSRVALPRYFGHNNHSSFVRIVNAWGFRRVTMGVDFESYYHELFLRGKPQLNQRMKRLTAFHHRSPTDKGGQSPNFYELAKTSPLPEAGGRDNVPLLNQSAIYIQPSAHHNGDVLSVVSSISTNNALVGKSHANNTPSNNSTLSNMPSSSSGINPPASTTDGLTAIQLDALIQKLERENENLSLRIQILECSEELRKLVEHPQQRSHNTNTVATHDCGNRVVACSNHWGDGTVGGNSNLTINTIPADGGFANIGAPSFHREVSSDSADALTSTIEQLTQEPAMVHNLCLNNAGSNASMDRGSGTVSWLELAGGGDNDALSISESDSSIGSTIHSNAIGGTMGGVFELAGGGDGNANSNAFDDDTMNSDTGGTASFFGIGGGSHLFQ